MKKDPFKRLFESHKVELDIFQPMVGYLHEDGEMQEFKTPMSGTMHLHRAIATCFGSAARRLRGCSSPGYNRTGLIGIYMIVINHKNEIVWQHEIDFSGQPL